MLTIEEHIEAARKSLLDLTMRNRLLNYRPSKARSVQIIDAVPEEIYDVLVIRNQPFRLGTRTAESEETRVAALAVSSSDSDSNDTSSWLLPDSPNSIPSGDSSRVKHILQTSFDPEALRDRLFYINQESQTVLEEQGYSVLFLALGFLVWKESPDAVELRKAPLILIPVELERGKRGYSKVRWTGEDIFANVSLHAKVTELGVSLPEFEMADDKVQVRDFLQRVRALVSSSKDWSVSDDACLDFFSFTKFVMYKDLDRASWPKDGSPGLHPLVREVLQPSGRPPEEGFSEEEGDEKLHPRDAHHVLDADPSQVAVIEDVKIGRNLVVEGPPGTGKSQTIANVIAELLVAGKTVLFVSEKMAALEVVKARLDEAGLGDFCLELHSRKANKKQVLQKLQHSLSVRTGDTDFSMDSFRQLQVARDELNAYARALREPIGKLGHSPFSLFSMKERSRKHFARMGTEVPKIQLDQPGDFSADGWSEALSALQDYCDALSLARLDKIRIWQGCDVGPLLPADEVQISADLSACKESLRKLAEELTRLEATAGVRVIPRLSQVQETITTAEVVLGAPIRDRDVLLSDAWNQPNQQAEELLRRISASQEATKESRAIFNDAAFQMDTGALLSELRHQSAKFLCFVRPTYRALRRKAISLFRAETPGKTEEVLEALDRLSDCKNQILRLQQSEQVGRSLFESLWQSEKSDVGALRNLSEWIVTFRRKIVGQALKAQSVELVCQGIPTDTVRSARVLAEKEFEKAVSALSRLQQLLKPDYRAIVGSDRDEADLTDLMALIELWVAGVPYLQKWSHLNARRAACLKTLASPLVTELEGGRLAPASARACLEGSYADGLLRLAFTERPALGQFLGELHERKVARFVELDREILRQNRKRILSRLYELRPRVAGGASPGSEAGVLLGEFNRKRGHMPIRKLMGQAGGLIQRIKPCFMMSPLSIAQFLDPRTARFDLILFDEASQVRPEDALGALLRGNQVVVMGDTKQLPPTSFFDHLVEGEESPGEDSAASIATVESILHQCSRSFPSKTLRWHYRSRHESLIAVSNQEFYENKLLIYPSPIHDSPDVGLHFIHLPSTIYDRGRSGVNREEARAVARGAAEHYRNFPAKSLGVGAFNIKQQQAILEEIEILLHQHPDLEEAFSSRRPEHFFVKNLETIQGDERDVIFLSIGFGFDANRKLSLNFGPLNQEGGERRLNVLISRARERCLVFANFKASDLSLEANSSFGVRALKVFLDYAETGRLGQEDTSREDTGSPFEDSVFDFLRSVGYEVRKQVGCAGFRVDLAIVDPESPGQSLLGIECDGAKYHLTPVARDRDRLRQEILHRHGWRIARIWSTDWYRNRADTQERLLAAIEQARRERKVPRSAPSSPTTSTSKSVPPILEPDQGQLFDLGGQPYERCKSLGFPARGELHEQPTVVLARAVSRVVATEGPVHSDEVIRRIRALWGLERTGDRIRTALSKAIHVAEKSGEIARRGDFLWSRENRPVLARRREADPPPQIDLICDEEISAAIDLVLERQFATALDDLVTQASRVVGILATSSHAANRIRQVVEKLEAESQLRRQPNGMLQRVQDKVSGGPPAI